MTYIIQLRSCFVVSVLLLLVLRLPTPVTRWTTEFTQWSLFGVWRLPIHRPLGPVQGGLLVITNKPPHMWMKRFTTS